MTTFKVKDMDKAEYIIPLFKTKRTIHYLFVWHPKLKWWQNVLCNTFFGRFAE